jgi:hypothetical protein
VLKVVAVECCINAIAIIVDFSRRILLDIRLSQIEITATLLISFHLTAISCGKWILVKREGAGAELAVSDIADM